jgi:hypothetical protein
VFLLFNENSPHLSELGPDQQFFEVPSLFHSFLPFVSQDVLPSVGDRRVPFRLPENKIIGLMNWIGVLFWIGLLFWIAVLDYFIIGLFY